MAGPLLPFFFGPNGRSLVVDASGRLVVNGNIDASGHIFGYGDTGRAIVVDSSGRLILSQLSPGLGGSVGGNFYEKDDHLIPDSANTFDVGSAASRFRNIFIGSGNFINGLGRDANWRMSPSGRLRIRGTHSPFVTLTPGATVNIDFNIGYNFRIFLNQSCTFVLHNPLDGERYLFHVKQANSGSNNITWPNNVLWPSGTTPTVTPSGGITAGHTVRDVFTLFYDSVDDVYLGGFSQDLF